MKVCATFLVLYWSFAKDEQTQRLATRILLTSGISGTSVTFAWGHCKHPELSSGHGIGEPQHPGLSSPESDDQSQFGGLVGPVLLVLVHLAGPCSSSPVVGELRPKQPVGRGGQAVCHSSTSPLRVQQHLETFSKHFQNMFGFLFWLSKMINLSSAKILWYQWWKERANSQVVIFTLSRLEMSCQIWPRTPSYKVDWTRPYLEN